MKRILICLAFLAFLTIPVAAQSRNVADETLPNGSKSDGCTLFPDGDYRDCCVAHDLDYFKGGSLKERRRSDNRLYKCVAAKKGWWHKIVAPVMWIGVRVGGVHFLPTPFRWGFGKKKIKKQVNRCRRLSKTVG